MLVPDTYNGNYISLLHGHYKLIVDYDVQESHRCRYIAIIFVSVLSYSLLHLAITYVNLSVSLCL